MAPTDTIAVIILAAGASSRLGSPKQLLQYGGNTLLQHSVQAAIDSTARPVIVVLGAAKELMQNVIDNTHVQVVINKDWKEGMASSIRCGITELLRVHPHAIGAVIILCDQPYITPGLINELVSAHKISGKAIVASAYRGTLGAPTFFHKTIFPALLELKGDVGAKSIIRLHEAGVAAVPFSKGDIDIDTLADYGELMKREYNS
jgi:molybdenum cofactor cytidylyltransferase